MMLPYTSSFVSKAILIGMFLTFSYSCFAQGFGSTPSNYPIPGAYRFLSRSNSASSHGVIDINGDGFMDFIHTALNNTAFGSAGNYYWKVYLGSATGFSSTSINWNTYEDFIYFASYSSATQYELMDMNKDGLPDLVNSSRNGAYGTSGNFYWKVYINNGSGFNQTPITWGTPADFIGLRKGYLGDQYDTRDMNGDSLPDLVETYTGGPFGTPGNYYWKVYLSTGTGFNSTPINWSTPVLAKYTSWLTGWQSGGITFNISDMTGDGLMDFILTNDQGTFGSAGAHYWKVYPGTGSGFSSTAINWTTYDEFVFTDNSSTNAVYNLIDMNGDAQADLVEASMGYIPYLTAGQYHWNIRMNTGSGFSSTKTKWDVPGIKFNALTRNGSQVTLSIVDYNGNGLLDLVHMYDSGYFGTTGSHYWKLYTNQTQIPVDSLLVQTSNNQNQVISRDSLQMNVQVSPWNASNSGINWSISTGTGMATISTSGMLQALDTGTVYAVATTTDGSGIKDSMLVTIIPRLVDSIQVLSFNGDSVFARLSLQLNTKTWPTYATDTSVNWSVTPLSGTATINSSGLLEASTPGEVYAVASTKDASGMRDSLKIRIIPILVTSVEITSSTGFTVPVDDSLQLGTTILPSNATDSTVSWTIAAGSGQATISSSGMVTPSKVGLISVIAMANDGTGKADTVTVTIIESTVGFSDYTPANSSLSLYPNPASSSITVTFPKDAKVVQLELVDLTGRIHFQASVRETNTPYLLDIKELKPGTYLLRCETSKGSMVRKFRKE